MKAGEKVGELTFASIFDENLWQNLVAGMNQQPPSRPKPGPRPSVDDIEPIIIRKKKNQTTTTTRGR